MSVAGEIPRGVENRPQRYRAALAAGLTPRQLRARRVTHLARDLYLFGAVAEWDRWRGYLSVLPEVAALSHATAAEALGLAVPWRSRNGAGPDLVHVTIPPERIRPRHRSGLYLHSRLLPAGDVTEVNGMRVTTSERVFVDLATVLGAESLVALGDQILNAELAEPGRLAERVDRAGGRRGVVLARRVLPHLDGRAQSVPESMLRWRLRAAGLIFTPQCPVRCDGRTLGHVDLGDERTRVGIEYEGRHHAEQEQFRYDLTRYTAFAAAGWLILRAGAHCLTKSGTAAFITEVAAAVRQRRSAVGVS